MFRGVAKGAASAAALLIVAFHSGGAAAQTCQCAPAHFAGACNATVEHQQGLNSIKVTSDSQSCSLVEWIYRDGVRDSEVVSGGLSHKIVLFDPGKPKPEIAQARCNICGSAEAAASPGMPGQPAAAGSGLAAEAARALQQEFGGGGTYTPDVLANPTTENWDRILSNVDAGNRQFAEEQRQLALKKAREEAERRERERQLAAERARQQALAAQQEQESGFGFFDMLNMAGTLHGAMTSQEGYMNALSQAAPELAPVVNGMAQAYQGNNPLAGVGAMTGGAGGGLGNINPYTGLGGGNTGGLAGLGGLGGMGGIGAPTGVRGTYAARPNLAEGRCPGFTIQNYRTHALNGGNNQQLFAFCGQAYEYYKWYLNAIEQGYSEADANRTYNEHEKVVRVLNTL